MRVNEIEIINLGGISNLKIKPNDQMNIICGPNGIGKTTVLEAIAHMFFQGNSNVLKRSVASNQAIVRANVFNDRRDNEYEYTISTLEPDKPTSMVGGAYGLSSGVLSIKNNRILGYRLLQSIEKDKTKNDNLLWRDTTGGVSLEDVKNWFVNRYLFSTHEGALKSYQLENLELAKNCFQRLSQSFTFSRVEASTHEIMVNTPTGEIYYEYLSSGFKSVISLIFALIKEIEYRFTDPGISASQFTGIILIDEIENHLHPEWQSKIVNILKSTFPSAQFFTTTHSPHVIQTAESSEIIALERDDLGVKLRSMPESESGFKGWTIEEVLIDVMGMNDLRTNYYKELIDRFQKGLDEGDIKLSSDSFKELSKALHPTNHLRKLFEFQLAAIKDDQT